MRANELLATVSAVATVIVGIFGLFLPGNRGLWSPRYLLYGAFAGTLFVTVVTFSSLDLGEMDNQSQAKYAIFVLPYTVAVVMFLFWSLVELFRRIAPVPPGMADPSPELPGEFIIDMTLILSVVGGLSVVVDQDRELAWYWFMGSAFVAAMLAFAVSRQIHRL